MTSINENNITFRQIKSYLEDQCIDINSIEAQYSKLTANTVTNTEKDKITVIPFSSDVLSVWQTEDGTKTEELISQIQKNN